jgi:hypothetical protein
MASKGRVLIHCAALAGAFAAGALLFSRSSPSEQPAARRVMYWHDPMHPEYRSDKPGTAPDCGMQLEPVYADGEGGETPARTDLPRLTGTLTAPGQPLAKPPQKAGIR